MPPTAEGKVPANKVKSGDYVLNHKGDTIKVLASYKDGDGAGASWCIEGYAEGKPTARIRGNPDQMIDVVQGP